MVVIVQGRLGIAGRVLDRQARDAGLRAQAHAFRDAGGLVREAIFEIGVDRDVGRGDELREMREHGVAADAIVGRPRANANPADVEASALKPRCCR
jgi:hypothetical protein